MEYLLDTINLELIERSLLSIPVCGVTSNPTIVKKEASIDFKSHMLKLKEIIGHSRTLHIQVTGDTFEEMMNDAAWITNNIGEDVYIKVPVTETGLQVIASLKSMNMKVTATAIYTLNQALLAIGQGADYIAPYYNRMENIGLEPVDLIEKCRKIIDEYGYKTKILAASFKNMGQVNTALISGAQSVTLDPTLIFSALEMSEISKAVSDFNQDWDTLSQGKKLYEM